MWTSTSFIYIFQTALVFEIKCVLKDFRTTQLHKCRTVFFFVFLNLIFKLYSKLLVSTCRNPGVPNRDFIFIFLITWGGFSQQPPIDHGANKFSWNPPDSTCSCTVSPRPPSHRKKLTPHPGSARSRLPGQGHGRLRVLGAPHCRRWRTPWTTEQAPPRTSDEKWACRRQQRTCLRPERENELTRRTEGQEVHWGRTLHTVQGVRVCVWVLEVWTQRLYAN